MIRIKTEEQMKKELRGSLDKGALLGLGIAAIYGAGYYLFNVVKKHFTDKGTQSPDPLNVTDKKPEVTDEPTKETTTH